MARWLQFVFFAVIVRPLVLVFIGLNVRRRERLPTDGPAIIIANHNSHLDTLVLMSLFPLAMLGKVRPVAAADYFLRNKVLAWFALNVMGIIPIRRERGAGDPLKGAEDALRNGCIVLLYPEGSRGEPEELATFKKGVWHLAKRLPGVPVTPVFLYGLGKALPKGEALFVPFFCDVFVGEGLAFDVDRNIFMERVDRAFDELMSSDGHQTWK